MPSSRAGPEPWRHGQVDVNGLRLHYVEMGAGPLVVLLHGFPEFWYCWRHQLPALAGAGFRAVAPDLRGYNDSDKPAGVAHYRLDEVARDIAELVRHLGERAVVVGHDWGGAVAWHLAIHRPEVVRGLVVLNAPHPIVFLRELSGPFQWARSWYIFLFQLPALPEWLARAGDFALLERIFRRQPVRRGAYTDEDLARYKEALGKPGALTAALNYYRALLRYPGVFWRPVPRVRVPTLVIWGERDPSLGVGLSEGLPRWAPGVRVARLPDASHWVQNDAPERVNALLLGFLHRHFSTAEQR
jgi:pimeloyl-ACP methyl ester carboxylesterase